MTEIMAFEEFNRQDAATRRPKMDEKTGDIGEKTCKLCGRLYVQSGAKQHHLNSKMHTLSEICGLGSVISMCCLSQHRGIRVPANKIGGGTSRIIKCMALT